MKEEVSPNSEWHIAAHTAKERGENRWHAFDAGAAWATMPWKQAIKG